MSPAFSILSTKSVELVTEHSIAPRTQFFLFSTKNFARASRASTCQSLEYTLWGNQRARQPAPDDKPLMVEKEALEISARRCDK